MAPTPASYFAKQIKRPRDFTLCLKSLEPLCPLLQDPPHYHTQDQEDGQAHDFHLPAAEPKTVCLRPMSKHRLLWLN